MKRLIFLLAALVITAPAFVVAQTNQDAISDPTIYFFGRDDCGFCVKQKLWLEQENLSYQYLNVIDDEAAADFFARLTQKHNLSKVTPLTVIGEQVIQGFDSPETTGLRILSAVEVARASDIQTISDHLERAPQQAIEHGAGCDENGDECGINAPSEFMFKLPFLGVANLKTFSLFSLSAILGIIDGFNPCAMWVLVTFLVLLSQAGSRKRMITLAGLFILAEAVMYNLILNVWYKTWDFIALDQIVTPLVGLLAIGGGSFFVWRWHKNRHAALVCDISSLEQQGKTINKFKEIINRPLSLATIFGIIAIAFSVNIIEFACSIGIPQAYTKILDLNMLTLVERQFYILVYTIGYMVDDFVVFGLAIWGFGKLQSHGHKYAQLSLIIGGLLMLILGFILVVKPSLIVL